MAASVRAEAERRLRGAKLATPIVARLARELPVDDAELARRMARALRQW